ncbi:ABC transporter ATP-binding protein [Mesorhizobium marinum]|uniref:ABC transporter ATP-binding protein n=1 Tax=Mesorhizobium marinum TaxID=3228790 RepID=UPI0034654C6A
MNAITGHMRETARHGPDGADVPPALALAAISKTFGDFSALKGVDFDLKPGEIHALLGENGAGKSTLMNVVAGIYTPDSGTVSVHGRPVAIRGPSDAQQLGVGMVHQHYKLVKPFTGLENILMAHPEGSYRQARKRLQAMTKDALDGIGFDVDLNRPVESLSVSEQQRIEILKVLVAGAKVIILDEPTAVLTDDEAVRLFTAIRNLAREGHSVVLVTHKLAEALTYADRITVMRGGQVVRTVLPSEVGEAELTALIVGSTIDERERRSGNAGKSVLKLRAVERRDDRGPGLRNLSFEVRSGEIYGIAGVGGNGQSALVEIVTGLSQVDSGNIWLDGHDDVTNQPSERMRRCGIACIPSDRQSDAIAGDLPVADNYAINGVLEGRYGSVLRVDRRRIDADTQDAVRRFEVMGVRGSHQKAGLLSGGNAQKLVIAREFSGTPSLILAHSPSRGLDIRASAAVHDHLRAARDRGAGVILISEDLDEIMLLSDRIGVMSRGSIVAEFETPADRQAIGKAMVGHG